MPTREEMIRELKLADMRRELKENDLRQAQVAPEAPGINDEMPEWLETSDRMVVKNLARNDGESIKYLQGKYPDAEFKEHDGDIIARKRGEQAFGKLDPSFSPFSNPIGTLKDLGRDALDLVGDVGQAGAEIAGTAAGAFAGLGPGSIPAAMAGGAAGSAAASTLKEALRKKLGVADEMSLGNIATDAAIGGLAPGVFSVAGKGIKYGAQKVAPKAYAWATGLSEEALKDIGHGAGEMTPQGARELIQRARGAITNNVDSAKEKFRQEFTKLRGSGAKVSIDPAIQRLDELIVAARNKRTESGSQLFEEEVRALEALKSRIFGASDNGKLSTNQIHTILENGNPSGMRFDPIHGKWIPDTNQIHTILENGNPSGMRFDPIHGKWIPDTNPTRGSIRGPLFNGKKPEIPGDSKTVLNSVDDYRIDPATGQRVKQPDVNYISGEKDISHAMDIKSAIKDAYIDYDKGIGGKLGQGGNAITHQEEQAALDLVNSLDDQIYGFEGGQALRDGYGKLVNDASYLAKKFNTEDKAQATLRALKKGKDHILAAQVDQLDDATKKVIKDANKRLEIHEFFNRPEDGNYIRRGADSALGKSPLSKTLTIAGGGLGATMGGYRGGMVGGFGGRVIGDFLTSPEMVKRLSKAGIETAKQMESLEKLLMENPKLLQAMYGASAAATQD